MNQYKAELKAAWMAAMHQIYPTLSPNKLELEYYKTVSRLKTIGFAGLALTVGYFAGKRK
jgi:hypothetical protein